MNGQSQDGPRGAKVQRSGPLEPEGALIGETVPVATCLNAMAGAEPGLFAQWREQLPLDPNLGDRLKAKRWERGFSIVAILAVFMFEMGLALSPKLPFRTLAIVAVFPLFEVVSTLVKRAWTKRPHPLVRLLIDSPCVYDQFPAGIVLRYKQEGYGRDEGVFSFVDGWIHFQGLKCSFSLPVTAVGIRSDPFQPFWARKLSNHIETIYLGYSVAEQWFEIGIVAYESLAGSGSGFRKTFGQTIRDWEASGISMPAEPLFPPREPQTSTFATLSRTRWLGLAILTTVCGVALFFFWRLLFDGSSAVLTLIVLASVIAVGVLFHRSSLKSLATIEELRMLANKPSNKPLKQEILS